MTDTADPTASYYDELVEHIEARRAALADPEEQSFFNAYVAENRQYDRYDASLKTAYNFGFADVTPDLTLAPMTGTPGLIILRSFGKFFGLAHRPPLN